MYTDEFEASFEAKEVKGKLVKMADESYYKISNVDEMRPFFMSILSNSNHWFFLSSNGGLTAGRKNSNYALFPYYTDDKITEAAPNTGNKTLIRVFINDKTYIWEPFSTRNFGKYKLTRNLYKNDFGNKVLFEEINHDLGLSFKYQWSSSDQFGFVKTSFIVNQSEKAVKVSIVDGLRNILPYGVPQDLQNSTSNLVDAYKKSELDEEIGLGIYSLSAIIVDRAEPSEALKANIAWTLGLDKPTHLLSTSQLDNFRKKMPIKQESEVKGEKGAFFIHTELTLNINDEKSWMLIADVNQNISDIIKLKEIIKNTPDIKQLILKDIEEGTKNLIELSCASDGLQLTEHQLRNNRHFANTLFNIMRGGIFDDNYQIDRKDFNKYIEKANKEVYSEKENLLSQLPTNFPLGYLKKILVNDNNPHFIRLATEYLPLKFSRRHGDPSRPWNKFSINTKSEEDGSKILDYEGNWRDIFQNWEALAHSYPEFIDGMIFKFLNASTFDGYNPYRVTKDGFEWEEIEPNNPWSYIGYWGDHQIIYLLKFLEFSENHTPEKLTTLFNKDLFVYANVPYKIKPYQDILNNPKDTIEFDEELHEHIHHQKSVLGADGALLTTPTNELYQVNFIEKILASVLAKISNFIPEGGIWLNTQRPEWNDANNALVGNGVSMVTLYYLRRFINFFNQITPNASSDQLEISEELAHFFNQIKVTLENHQQLLSGKINDVDRKTIQDGLGIAGSNYRNLIYQKGFTNKKVSISKDDLLQFFEITLKFIDHSIAANKRKDHLYHAYNILTITSEKEMSITHLEVMLEGQVAVLSSGYLNAEEAATLLDSLKCSKLFRPDQYSYMLYPNKDLPTFFNKNNIPNDKVRQSKLLMKLVEDGNKNVVEKDVLGNYHFNGSFNNAESLKVALDKLKSKNKYAELIQQDEKYVFDLFESVFNHKAFTGRSGTFFGYEGLGSIYWHMVSKLLLSVQENCITAINNDENPVIIGKLLDHYYEINEGIGVNKPPKVYGAVPTDPYSHTPAGKGAQQPGMTGQVKEDVISRFGELGVFVKEGKLQFKPSLLRRSEFLKETKTFSFTDVKHQSNEIELPKDSLCFTYCQVPVIYKMAQENRIEVEYDTMTSVYTDSLTLNLKESKQLFERTGEIKQIKVSINKSLLK